MNESKDMSNLKITDVNTGKKHFFLQQAGLPDNFSMEKLYRLLDALFPVLDKTDHLSQYVRLLEKIGVLSYEDDSTILTLTRPVELLVRQHIKNRLDASKVNVDETILERIISTPDSDRVAPNNNQQNKINLVLLKDK